MSKTYFPFDAGAGANVTEAQWRDMARLWRATGVVDGELNELAVSEKSGAANMSVDVATGVAWIRGHFFKSDAVENLPISAAHATLARIDRVVLQVDFTANTIDLAVLEGTADAAPTAPTLTQTASTWEISLAQVSVPAADTAITNAQITDERTILGTPAFDYATAPADGETWVYNATSGLFEPGGSGPSASTELIAETTLAAAAASISFTSIPQTYRHLAVVLQTRNDTASNQDVMFRLNADTGTNYDFQYTEADATATTVNRSTNQTAVTVGRTPGTGGAAGNAALIDVLVGDYRGTTFNKRVRSHVAWSEATNTIIYRAVAGHWRNTAAVTRIDLQPASGNFLAGTVAALYGIKGA